MRIIAALLAVLPLASCKEKPTITPEARGAAFFAATAEKFGELVFADLKAGKPEWYRSYLKETGAKDDAELLRKMQIGKGVLGQSPASFALTEAQEAAMKAGKFADEENRKRVQAAAARFAGREMPDAHRVAIRQVESGVWAKGIELEFAVRLLEARPAGTKH